MWDFACLAIRPSGYLRVSYHIYKIGCFLVRGISLPSVQLFVIAIENILQGGVGNLTSKIEREPMLKFLNSSSSQMAL